MLILLFKEIKLNLHLSHWAMAEIKILLLFSITKDVGEEITRMHYGQYLSD